jgi:hypothetical protein
MRHATKTAVLDERLVVALTVIQHHFAHAFDVAVGRFHAAGVYAKATRQGGADLTGIEFDLAALQNIVRERPEDGLLPDGEVQRAHLPAEVSLLEPGGRERCSESPMIPAELRPIRKLMDVGHSPQP